MTEDEFQEFVLSHAENMHPKLRCPLDVACIVYRREITLYNNNPFPQLAANTLNLNLSYASGVARGFDGKSIHVTTDEKTIYFTIEQNEYRRGYAFGEQCRKIAYSMQEAGLLKTLGA